MQHILITVIVICCAFLIGRRLLKNLKNTDKGVGNCCGCSGCSDEMSSSCSSPDNSEKNIPNRPL